MPRRWTVILLLIAVIAAGCGGDEGDEADDTGATAEAPAADTTEPEPAVTDEPTTMGEPTDAGTAEDEATVAVASTDLGDILVDGEGMTLYAFLNDENGEPTCYDDCLQNWPILPAPATAEGEVDGALLTTVERDDGSTQAVYGDWPLYYFAGDSAPGDVNGQGVGDVWFVVDPAGEPVQEAAPAG